MNAKEILKLIENVDPKDNDALDEIDAKTDAFVKKLLFEQMAPDWWDERTPAYWSPGTTALHERCYARKYTRSRDALKAIRPERRNTFKITYHIDGGYTCFCNRLFKYPILPTEELAELHAIIQAVAYEQGLIEEKKSGIS